MQLFCFSDVAREGCGGTLANLLGVHEGQDRRLGCMKQYEMTPLLAVRTCISTVWQLSAGRCW